MNPLADNAGRNDHVAAVLPNLPWRLGANRPRRKSRLGRHRPGAWIGARRRRCSWGLALTVAPHSPRAARKPSGSRGFTKILPSLSSSTPSSRAEASTVVAIVSSSQEPTLYPGSGTPDSLAPRIGLGLWARAPLRGIRRRENSVLTSRGPPRTASRR